MLRLALQPLTLLFVLVHVWAAVTVVTVPIAWETGLTAVALVYFRMIAVTGAFHRYFSHKAFKTSRLFQFFMAVAACTAFQKGPLWWAAHHRLHHRHSDQEGDPHSPITGSVWHAHIGWVLADDQAGYDPALISDFYRYPELRLLERLNWLPGVLLGALLYWIGGYEMLAWALGAGTVALYHATFLVNSACHLKCFGFRRYDTPEHSRNIWWVALFFTCGEGWHNNHHFDQACARQGRRWYELDITYCVIVVLGWLRLVWDIREPRKKEPDPKPAPEPAAA